MVKVEKVNRGMFEEIYPLLQEIDKSNLSRADWRSIFDHPWENEEDYCGYALFDGRVAVGFVGVIFSQRWISGRAERFCNLNTWIIQKQYRGHTLSLVLPAIRSKDYTYTVLSGAEVVNNLVKRLGFTQLDSKLISLVPYDPWPAGRFASRVRLTQDPGQIEGSLSEMDRRLFHDHFRLPHCRFLLLSARDRYCLVIYTTVSDKTRFRYNYIHYISDARLFAEMSGKIRAEIARHSHTPFVLVDSRLVQAVHLPFGYPIVLKKPRYYRSSSLQPWQVDNLYSELVLLNFGTIRRLLPDLRAILKMRLVASSHT